MKSDLAIATCTHLGLTAVAAGWLHGYAGNQVAASLLAGSAFALVNLWLWAVVVRGAVFAVARRGNLRLSWIGLAVLGKLTAFLLLGAALLWRAPLEPLSFAAGVALLSVAFVFQALVLPSEASAAGG